MGDLSPHFSRNEFRDRRTGELVDPPCRLLVSLELLRQMCGGTPLRIVSGYRSKSTNDAVGGAKSSRHLLGDAVDIPTGYATVDQAAAAGFSGIGSKDQWAVHVDTRPDGARWKY